MKSANDYLLFPWQRIGAALLLLSIFSAPLAAALPPKEQVDNLAMPYIDNEIVVGMTVAILHDGEQVTYGYGQLSEKDKRQPDGKTIYEIGSITKVFTGLLLADAVAVGRVQLNQPAAELLPTSVKMPSRGERAITLEDLSTHVSGLPRLPANFRMTDPKNPYVDYSADDLYAFLDGYELPRAPGTKSEYSNLAAGLLGQLLASEAGGTYEKLLKERICQPLRLSDTTISLNKEQQARLAPPHNADGQLDSNWDFQALAGAGAIRSTTDDLMLYAAASLDPASTKLAKAIELAWQEHQKPLKETDFAMGLGWLIARDRQTRFHNGQTGGYHSAVFVNRPLKTAVVILTNTATGEVDALAEQLVQMLAGMDVEPRTFEETAEVAPEIMARYAGKYQLAPGAVFTFTLEGEKLFAQLTGQPQFRVFPRSDTEWFYKVVEASLTFSVDESGKCQSVELLQNGRRLKAPRIE